MARENIPVGLFYATYPSDCTYKLNSRKERTEEMGFTNTGSVYRNVKAALADTYNATNLPADLVNRAIEELIKEGYPNQNDVENEKDLQRVRENIILGRS